MSRGRRGPYPPLTLAEIGKYTTDPNNLPGNMLPGDIPHIINAIDKAYKEKYGNDYIIKYHNDFLNTLTNAIKHYIDLSSRKKQGGTRKRRYKKRNSTYRRR
jgi:hypothetical protein